MDRKVSGCIGIGGGALDIAVGSLLLTQSMNPTDMGMIGFETGVVAVFLLLLGLVVLVTGTYVFSASMMRHSAILSGLMILYGVIMLILGVGMITGMFRLMMMGASLLSGGLMLLSGAAMLYSGVSMRRR
jgi:hypothetical protein